MILIIILLILIGLTSYAAFNAYHAEDRYSCGILLIGLLIELVVLLRTIAIELQLITIT